MNSTVESYLCAAQSHLEVAQFCYKGDHFGAAIAEAYHLVLAAVKVRRLERGKKVPDRHSRSLNLLYHEFVENGDLGRDVSRFVHEMQDYRDDWIYEAEVSSSKSERAINIAADVKARVDSGNSPS